jgi:serine protease
MATNGVPPPTIQPDASAVQSAGRVMVKFRDGSGLPYRDDLNDELEARSIGAWRELSAKFPGVRIRRLYTSSSPEELLELARRARERDATYKPPDFHSYFVIECPPGARAEDIAALVRTWQGVEDAHAAPEISLPALVTSDPRLQGFHAAAPDGIDAYYAWDIPGGDGSGQTLVDLEAGWTLDHEDLDLAAKANVLNNGPSGPIYAGHGTSVLGVIRALDNGNQCVGIAPQAAVHLVSIANASLFLDPTLIPPAIVSALGTLAAGNVLLLETQVAALVNGLTRWVPCEADDHIYPVIRLATALGVVVIEPAGSSDVDLSAVVDKAGLHILDTTLRGEFRDSGAIVVGGATSTAPHTHLAAFSAHGPRIDCYGWAENVASCDSNIGGSTTLYTNTFNGTSAASAIVAGAVLLIQGMLEAAGQPRYSPAAMREVLRDVANGTPVTPYGGGAATRAIPDLRKIAEGPLKVAPDIYVRDYLGDTGAADGVSQAMSPDIIVVNADAGDPQVAFGTGSGTEGDDALSDSVVAGQDNFVYVRVANRGGTDASNVTVTAYWSEPSTLITPDLWMPIGSEVIANIPADGSLSVSPKIVWTAADIPQPGHYCFVTLASHTLDPAPVWASFSTFANPNAWDSFVAFISVNNNVAWRNFDIVALAAAANNQPLTRRFWMRGAFDRARPMGFEVVADLPAGVQATLEVPQQFVELWRLHDRHAKIEKGRARIPLLRDGRSQFQPIHLPARANVPMRLHVVIPHDAPEVSYHVYARQTYEGIELGRVTWRFQHQQPNVTSHQYAEETDRQRRIRPSKNTV